MDNVKDLLLKASTQFQIFFSTLHMPYRHSTIEGVYQDPDIENQYEKVSKKIVVGLSAGRIISLRICTLPAPSISAASK